MQPDRLKRLGLALPALFVGVLPQLDSINKSSGALQLVAYGVQTVFYGERPVSAGGHRSLQVFQTLFQASQIRHWITFRERLNGTVFFEGCKFVN